MTPKELQNALSVICEQIAGGNYDQAKAVFNLTPCEPADHPLNLLIEALGMMLLRVEAREFEISRLLEEISEARSTLKQNQLRLTQENRRLRKRIKIQKEPQRPVAQSSVMQILVRQAEQVAQTDAGILLTGETGTGKDLFARYIHSISSRASKAFIPINFSALPADRMDAELFGVEEDPAGGAPARIGRLEQADGGSLLLNEIRTLPLETQHALLRTMETGFLTRMNGVKKIPVNVRILAATNRDLEHAVKKGYFLEGLYACLTRTHLVVPPLRERWDDIPVLARLFLAQLGGHMPQIATHISDYAMNMLISYHWPGNVRELENVIRNAALVADEDCIHPRDLAEVMGPGLSLTMQAAQENGAGRINKLASVALSNLGLGSSIEEGITLAEIEAAHIKKVLTLTSGNKSRAAQLLGISREGLRTKLLRTEHHGGEAGEKY